MHDLLGTCSGFGAKAARKKSLAALAETYVKKWGPSRAKTVDTIHLSLSLSPSLSLSLCFLCLSAGSGAGIGAGAGAGGRSRSKKKEQEQGPPPLVGPH